MLPPVSPLEPLLLVEGVEVGVAQRAQRPHAHPTAAAARVTQEGECVLARCREADGEVVAREDVERYEAALEAIVGRGEAQR